MNNLGQRLREARRRAGIKQKDLDNLLGFGKNNVRMYEHGYREPSPERVELLESFITKANASPPGKSYNDGGGGVCDPCDVCANRQPCGDTVYHTNYPAMCEIVLPWEQALQTQQSYLDLAKKLFDAS